MSGELYFDCPQCGEIGLSSELHEHPTRPVAMDIGFCFSCGSEIDELITLDQVTDILLDYDEDPSAVLSEIHQRAWK